MPDAGLDHCPRASTIGILRMAGKNSKLLYLAAGLAEYFGIDSQS
jgi:hypothetical protein